MLEQLQRSERDTLPTNFAHVHLGLGQFDTGLEWFDRVVEERDKNMMPILSYAHFDPIQIHVSQSCARYSWRVGEDACPAETCPKASPDISCVVAQDRGIDLEDRCAPRASLLQTLSGTVFENLALRHQLGVLGRAGPKQLKLMLADRIFWVWPRRVWAEWKSALLIVQQATVKRDRHSAPAAS